MSKMKNNWDALDYAVEIRRVPEEFGGGYIASIPQLGRAAFVGDGDTAREALNSLQFCFDSIVDMIDEGELELPYPSDPLVDTFYCDETEVEEWLQGLLDEHEGKKK